MYKISCILANYPQSTVAVDFSNNTTNAGKNFGDPVNPVLFCSLAKQLAFLTF